MTNESSQPLREQPPRRKDDSKLVAEVLGTKAADEMQELTGGTQEQETETKAAKLDLSADEQAATTEAEKTIEEMRRKEYLVWAKVYGRDGQWVDDTFKFNLDGTVIAKDCLDFFGYRIKAFPEGLVKSKMYINLADNHIDSLRDFCLPPIVDGYLGLSGNRLTMLEGMPKKVLGAVFLGDNNLELLDNLPKKIGGSLHLKNNPATSIPAGLDIGGSIVLTRQQTELAADAQAKGYNVEVK